MVILKTGWFCLVLPMHIISVVLGFLDANSETHCIHIKWLFHQLIAAHLHAMSFGQCGEDIASLSDILLTFGGANLPLTTYTHSANGP